MPHSDLFSGRVQLAAIAPAICAELAAMGAGPSARGSPSVLTIPVLFWLNLGALCGQQKPLMSWLIAMRTKCSEGLGAQEARKCVVLVMLKGTIACS